MESGLKTIAFLSEKVIKDLRGGPLDILGGGGVRSKKKFLQEIELEKKILHALEERKKIRGTS